MKLFIIIISIIGIMYVPWKLISLYNNLIPVNGTLIEIKKTYTRIRTYKLRLSAYNNNFYNYGTGFLSQLKNDKKILYGNVNKEITFFINKKDFSKLNTGENIKYVALQKKNIFIDLFYYHYAALGKVFFSLIYILLMGANIYAKYTFGNKIFEVFIYIFLFLCLVIMIL